MSGVESIWTKLRQIEKDGKLIVLAYGPADADDMVVGTDGNGDDIMADLTDEEWEAVVREFEKSADYIRSQCWELITELVRERVAARNK